MTALIEVEKMQRARPKVGPLLFVPARWQRVAFLKWLKRVHAWTGLWGALIFFGLGLSGFLLNHRSILKIETGVPREVSRLDVAVAPGVIRDERTLDMWAKRTLGAPGKGRTPPPDPNGAEPVVMLGRSLRPAIALTRSFNLVDGRLTVSAVPGSQVVSVRRERVGLLAVLKNLHLGAGLGVGWVLLIDTIAGALLTMSVTGVLLWSRLHGGRIVAAALMAGCLLWAVAASAPSFNI